jgi:hypothetical protein
MRSDGVGTRACVPFGLTHVDRSLLATNPTLQRQMGVLSLFFNVLASVVPMSVPLYRVHSAFSWHFRLKGSLSYSIGSEAK